MVCIEWSAPLIILLMGFLFLEQHLLLWNLWTYISRRYLMLFFFFRKSKFIGKEIHWEATLFLYWMNKKGWYNLRIDPPKREQKAKEKNINLLFKLTCSIFKRTNNFFFFLFFQFNVISIYVILSTPFPSSVCRRSFKAKAKKKKKITNITNCLLVKLTCSMQQNAMLSVTEKKNAVLIKWKCDWRLGLW